MLRSSTGGSDPHLRRNRGRHSQPQSNGPQMHTLTSTHAGPHRGEAGSRAVRRAVRRADSPCPLHVHFPLYLAAIMTHWLRFLRCDGVYFRLNTNYAAVRGAVFGCAPQILPLGACLLIPRCCSVERICCSPGWRWRT